MLIQSTVIAAGAYLHFSDKTSTAVLVVGVPHAGDAVLLVGIQPKLSASISASSSLKSASISGGMFDQPSLIVSLAGTAGLTASDKARA